jgi:very-short-patch-repair endonuclease
MSQNPNYKPSAYVQSFIGKQYGTWTVIAIGQKSSYLLCRCSCGIEREVYRNSLIDGVSTNCGCVANANTTKRCLIDLTGQKFGFLTVLNRNLLYIKHVRYDCECQCGRFTTVRSGHLKRGAIISCGYCRHTTEMKCREIFESILNVKFNKAKPKFLSLSNRSHLELDGYCEELKLAFEYDGEQHYRDVDCFKTTSIKTRQELDRIKTELCQTNGIHLIRIPYTQKRNLKKFIEAQIQIWHTIISE